VPKQTLLGHTFAVISFTVIFLFFSRVYDSRSYLQRTLALRSMSASAISHNSVKFQSAPENYDTTNSICLFINCDRLADSSYVFAGRAIYSFGWGFCIWFKILLNTVIRTCNIRLRNRKIVQNATTVLKNKIPNNLWHSVLFSCFVTGCCKFV